MPPGHHLALPDVDELIRPDVMLRVDDIDWCFGLLASLRPWNVYMQRKCNIISVFNSTFLSCAFEVFGIWRDLFIFISPVRSLVCYMINTCIKTSSDWGLTKNQAAHGRQRQHIFFSFKNHYILSNNLLYIYGCPIYKSSFHWHKPEMTPEDRRCHRKKFCWTTWLAGGHQNISSDNSVYFHNVSYVLRLKLNFAYLKFHWL